MLLVGWIAFEHLVLRDQAPDTLGKKDLVAELDRRAYLAALDQVGVRLEDREDLFAVGDLLAIDRAASCLVDHAICQPAIVGDLIV